MVVHKIVVAGHNVYLQCPQRIEARIGEDGCLLVRERVEHTHRRAEAVIERVRDADDVVLKEIRDQRSSYKNFSHIEDEATSVQALHLFSTSCLVTGDQRPKISLPHDRTWTAVPASANC